MNSIEKQGMTFEEAVGFLARAQYEYNNLGKIVSTKDPDSLRSACDEEMRLRHQLYGVKSINAKIGDAVVGTYTVCETKEKPEQTVKRLRIDPSDALRWTMEDAPDNYYQMLAEAAVKIAEDYMLLEGEVLPGARMVEETVPAEPSKYKNTVLKIDPAKAAKAIGASEVKELGA